ALDAMTRVQMQTEVEQIFLNEKSTACLVTHDIEEAIFLSDRIVIITPRPAQINTIIKVDLPRSRDRNDSEFVRLRKSVLNIFNESNGTYVI
ncbi:MAG: ABC transporter ATP-binding protein, partial [Lachnospiraceae bacterium]|nr:ABC transporter ATP-binding protein [Lachnospiraceae bacterium]